MDPSVHNLSSLFQQLGLDGSDEGIQSFLDDFSPLPSNVTLYKANFWTTAQAAFLKEAIDEDADWAEVVDQLDSMLR